MKSYQYKNYDHYIESQKEANRKKSKNVWAVEENIKAICDYINKNYAIPMPLKGLCHGTRGGHEQKWFMKYIYDSKVIGSEIGDASAPNTVQHDFNKIKPEWIDEFDFIYSNSFDHSYDPATTFNIWCNQLKSGGLLILEYDKRNEHTGEVSKSVNKTDPNSITIEELIVLIPQWFAGAEVIDVIDLPVIKKEFQKAIIVQVQHAN